MTYTHRTEAETRQTILKILAGSANALTRKQIAIGLGRSKSPHILEIIEALVEEGKLEKSIYVHHNGVQGYAYQLREGVEIEC